MSAKSHIIPVFVPHLGCPNDCVFCNQRRISGSAQPAEPHAVAEMLDRLDKIDGGYELAFYGGSFTAIPKQEQEKLLNAVLPFLRLGKIRKVRVSTRPDAVDEDALQRLSAYGVETVELGAQSMCGEVLKLSARGHTAEDVRRASRLIKSKGMKLILQMMTGLPGDSEERALYTAREIAALEPDGVRIYPTVIIKDTPLFQMWREGLYSEHTVEDAVAVCARILPELSGISIIRLGLNPTDGLSAGEAVGGAYHPALGELVYSRVMRNKAERLLKGVPPGSRVVLGVAPQSLSQMIGQKRCNIKALTEMFGLGELNVIAADLDKGEVTDVFKSVGDTGL